MKHKYIPSGVCSKTIEVDIEEGVLRDINFEGGCSGNLKGLAILAKNRKLDEVRELLNGVRCGMKATSCPDQLAKAIEAAVEKEKKSV